MGTVVTLSLRRTRFHHLFKIVKMADKYLGKYDRVSADKYDEFLKELGVNMLLRKAATASSPVFEVTYDTDSETWSFKTSTMLKSMELKFKLDEEFDEKSPDVAMSRPKLPRKAIASSLFKTPSKKAKSPLKSFVSSRVMRLFKPLLSLVAISSVPKSSRNKRKRLDYVAFICECLAAGNK